MLRLSDELQLCVVRPASDVGHRMQDAKQDALAFHDQLAAMRAAEVEVSARLSTELRCALALLRSTAFAVHL